MKITSTIRTMALGVAMVSGATTAMAQLSIDNSGVTYTIDFDATVAGVNNGVFAAGGFEPAPAAGQVDSDAWSVNGLSQGNLDFGQTGITSDYAQGTSTGGVFSGGVYAWEVATGDFAIGLQPTGSDWTPGDLRLKMVNNTGLVIDTLFIDYDIIVNNDADRGNDFFFSHSADNMTYTPEPSLDYTSVELTQGSVMWVTTPRTITLTGLNIAAGANYYIMWDGADNLGGGGRDEFAVDNIDIMAGTLAPPPQGDTIKPFIVDGEFISNTQVVVAWSEGVTQITAEDANNYTGTPIDVTAASHFAIDSTLLTFASPLMAGVEYEIIFENVEDTSVNNNVMDNDTINFFFNDYTGSDLVINEIFYNEPTSVTTDLEYIELFNNGATAIELGGLEMVGGVDLFFPDYSMAAGEYIILASNEVDFAAAFPGVTAPVWGWDNGNLDNSSDDIEIINTLDDIVDRVSYDDGAPWPSQADGDGFALILCDPASNNNLGISWYVTNTVAATIGGTPIFASPGAANMCAPIPAYPIATVHTEDANGVADSLDVVCELTGIVYGVDLRGGNGLGFTMIDNTGGINVFSFDDVDGYVVTEGDEIKVIGQIDFFNGLTEIIPWSIEVLSTDNCLKEPTLVTEFSEATESDYIKLVGAEIVGGSWPSGGFSENLQVTIAGSSDTLTMRIDSDTDIETNLPMQPMGTFDLVGIGGQFDSSDPRLDGYQIFPMTAADFITNPQPAVVPDVVINEFMAENDTTIADAAGDFDDWIEIYNTTGTDIDLAGMFLSNDAANPTMWRFPSCDANTVVPANGWLLVWADNEPSEGSLHTNFDLDINGGFIGLYAVDGAGIADTINYTTQNVDVSFGRFLDGSSLWFTQPEPTPGAANIPSVGIEEVNGENPLMVYPNPVKDGTVFFNRFIDVQVINLLGQPVSQARQVNQLDVSAFEAGIYILRTPEGDTVRLIKN